MASYKRAHSDTATEPMAVVQRTTSRTTTTTVATTTTTVVTTSNGLGTTKETAIRIEDDPEVIHIEKPVKKKSKRSHDVRGSYPCGCKKWVHIPDDLIDAYDVSVCRICSRHPNSKYEVYMFAHFVHEEGGDYECPYGDCEGNVRYLCYECRRRNP